MHLALELQANLVQRQGPAGRLLIPEKVSIWHVCHYHLTDRTVQSEVKRMGAWWFPETQSTGAPSSLEGEEKQFSVCVVSQLLAAIHLTSNDG